MWSRHIHQEQQDTLLKYRNITYIEQTFSYIDIFEEINEDWKNIIDISMIWWIIIFIVRIVKIEKSHYNILIWSSCSCKLSCPYTHHTPDMMSWYIKFDISKPSFKWMASTRDLWFPIVKTDSWPPSFSNEYSKYVPLILTVCYQRNTAGSFFNRGSY